MNRPSPTSTGTPAGRRLQTRPQITEAVTEILRRAQVVDIHTHLYPPTFGTPVSGRNERTDPSGLMLWGIDELLTYHYLIAEVFRVVPTTVLSYEQFWRMSRSEQADHIWRHLFLERSPISEACRGVVTTLTRLGLDPADKDLAGYRTWFGRQDANEMIDRVMEAAGVESITMTNNVFDDNERRYWLAERPPQPDPRFRAVVRMDPLLVDWPAVAGRLQGWGYKVDDSRSAASAAEGRRFLNDWIDRTQAIYVAASLPPSFQYPADDLGAWALEQMVLPVCQERGFPLALMIGARRGVNPALRDAGDTSGVFDLAALENLCAAFPQNRFLITLLARENQHGLAVAARKFSNLMIFGCWWFLNTPSLIEEITRLRLELLGLSFIPQHSDARVLEQLIYKWQHSREVLAKVLADRYAALAEAGWPLDAAAIEQDVSRLFKGNFTEFLGRGIWEN